MEQNFRAATVWLILNGRVEEALKFLAEKYGVEVPQLEVGLPKKNREALGCYDGKRRTISVLNSDVFKDPFVILHEFYHHLRMSRDSKHRGTEKYANAYAKEFVAAFCLAVERHKK